MKKNQFKKAALTATIFITMLSSCKKEPGFLPGNPDNPQSTEKPSAEEKLSPDQLREEEKLTSSITASTTMPTTPIEGLHQFKKSPIPFKSFEMVNQNGEAISPDKVLTLKSGKKITAKAYFTRLNSMEQALNKNGFTLRNDQPVVVSETETKSEYLDGMIAKQPQSIGALRTNQELDKFMTPVKKVGNLVLRPMDDYSPEEKKALEGYVFQNSGDNITASRSTVASPAPPISNVAAMINPTVLKKFKTIALREWSFGDPGKIKATIRGELIREANIYQFDPQNPDKSMSEVKVTGKGKIDGIIYNYPFNIVTAEASFYAPASAEKSITANLTVSVAGINVLNLPKSFAQKADLYDFRTWGFNKSVSIQVPIFWGLMFTGKIGVAGLIGLNYSASLGRGYVNASVTPYSSLTGYAEAGVSFLGIVGGGVGSNLTVLSGSLLLRGSMYVSVQDARQIVFGGAYYFGYNLEFLKGRVYCYAEVCIPWVYCYRAIEHTFFSWDGWSQNGTILQDETTYAVANL